MVKLLGRWLKIYENEIGVFLWTALLLFLIRSSNLLFDNFAETAFLKRFGVQYLPIVNAANSIVTFFLMGIQAGLMIRFPGSRLLAYTLAFCGFSVAGIRFLIPLKFDLIYPLLYVLKSQYEVLFGLLFWNLANDLFNTRQSKRIFPYITAIGIAGGIIGSFTTPLLARTISINNLMFVYLGTTLLAATAVTRMGSLYPATLLLDDTPRKSATKRSFVEEIKDILPAIRESKLMKVLVIIAFAPNVVIPIINYQFSFAVNQAFATEHSMITFYGFFRGFQNMIALAIILFSSRIYSRFGLPVALMFHPFNYMLAFLAFLFRFDIISAMYARLSTAVLRNAINAPASAVLMGLLPESKRIVMRSFLRGTVVRIGILLGSGLTLLSQDYMSPRYLSLVALPFVSLWIFNILSLKKHYAAILIDLIKGKVLDLKELASEKASHIFGEKKVKQQLVQSFLSSHGEGAVWYARLLQSLGEEKLDELVLSTFKSQDDKTKLELLPILSPKAGKEAVKVFRELADPDKPDLMVAFARTAARIYKGMPLQLQKEIFEAAHNPEVKAYALIGLYRESPGEYEGVIDGWLKSDRLPERRAGAVAAGGTGNVKYGEVLQDMLKKEEDVTILPLILNGLRQLETQGLNELAEPFLSHREEAVRLAALDAFQVENDDDERKVIAMMGDLSDKIRDLAIRKLEDSSYLNVQLLIESLGTSGRTVRDGIFKLIKSLDIKDVDRVRYFRGAIERGYMDVEESEALRRLPESLERDLLITHLDEQRKLRLDNVLRGMAAYDSTGRMRIIRRGLWSSDARRRANSCEALENFMDPALSRLMMPLLEDIPVHERITAGRKFFNLKGFGSNPQTLYARLLSRRDWVTVVLTLFLASGQDLNRIDEDIMRGVAGSEDKRIRQALKRVLHGPEPGAGPKEGVVKNPLTISEKIEQLRKIEVFKGLSVSELAAIASVTEEVEHPVGTTVIQEGDMGDMLFLVLEGEVSVIKAGEGPDHDEDFELERIGSTGYFGEMSLFEDLQRSASIKTTRDSRFLVLDKGDFLEIAKEFPEIPLQICKELSRRIRTLHEKVIHFEENSL